MTESPGIYVHLPFCHVHCAYCDFPLTTRISLSDRYYASLLREIRQKAFQDEADSLYFGGGTPSLAPAEVILEIKKQFRIASGAEITLEANPDDINQRNLYFWRKAGINRLSIGVQSLEPGILKSMLRRHTPETAMAALEEVREIGFRNINVDLMLGYPDETDEGFFSGLEIILRFRPEHLSLYLLELHENSALAKQVQSGKKVLPEEVEQIERFTFAIQMLQSAGYEHYEVSNFALPGFASRHNLKYWTDTAYAGYGAGACSYLHPERTQNLPLVSAYIQAVESGLSPVLSRIREDAETNRKNALIFGLRKRRGIILTEFESQFGTSPLNLFGDSLEGFLQQGLLELTNESLRLTFQGMLVSNNVLSVIV